MFLRIIIALLVVAIPTGPLVSNAATNPTAIPDNPCTLIAQSDAGQALQGGVQPALMAQTAIGSLCQYQSVDQSMNILVQNVNPYFVQALPFLGAQLLSGIGDAAYIFRNAVYMQKGSNFIEISMYSSSLNDGSFAPQLTALATIAAARM